MLALYNSEERLHQVDFQDFLFLDTETTGLSGAGTFAFMVGVAFFEKGSAEDALVVRQYFLRDHSDEPAMLMLLDNLLASKAGLVTFNGRSFDLPLLNSRFIMNRMPTSLMALPHVDLLLPSRRLWRRRLGSCALSALEQNLLGVARSTEDVPGWLIPGIYRDYLRTGDGRELRRVFYHNELDLLSMVTLTGRVTGLIEDSDSKRDPIDELSLGIWQAKLGLTSEAESSLRSALRQDLPLHFYRQGLQELGLLLKRTERREEAVPIWQQAASTSFDRVDAHIELAKHYEWQHRDLEAAIMWSHEALRLVERWGSTVRAAPVREHLTHRLSRLERKKASSDAQR
jgi:uncharacterized protein YprB with RNaseH-like and TPR domain